MDDEEAMGAPGRQEALRRLDLLAGRYGLARPDESIVGHPGAKEGVCDE